MCYPDPMPRNWSTGKLGDLSNVTEKACGKKSGTESSSPCLRLTVSPNLSSASSVLGLSHVSSHVTGQMVYSYSHATLIYL